MDLSNPWSLMTGLLVGLIGLALLMYGKKEQRVAPIAAGLVLCIAPYFIASLLATWLLAAGCLGGLFAFSRQG